MPVIFETNKINEKMYEDLITRQLVVNLGKGIYDFLDKWNIIIYPLEAAEDFKQYFAHIEGETNLGIAWGITTPDTNKGEGGDIYCFINDTRNPFILRSNFIKISHELGHALARRKFGNQRSVRKYDDPGARAGTVGASYVTKVHDQFYGEKKFISYWVRWKFMWMPVKMLFIYDLLNN